MICLAVAAEFVQELLKTPVIVAGRSDRLVHNG